jgi:molecular chaperone GrpE
MSKKKENKQNEEIEEVKEEDGSESLEDLKEKIEELEEQNRELEEKYLRAVADFENIKKRLEREKMQAVSYANEEFARDLLPVIDSMDFAAESAEKIEENSENDEYVKKIEEGIALTIEQFKKVMQKHGIELIDIDSGFNPHFHDAVMQVESEDHEEGEIVQLLQKGYKIKDRVLRPAMVSIAK